MEAREAQERRAVFVQYMQRSFRWTDDDCAKFIDKVRNIRDKTKSSEEKPTVTSLDEVARQQFEVVGSGSLTRNGDAFTTAGDFSNHSGGGWAIFVMSPNGNIYAGSHKVGLFHHSSFLAGGNVAGAGEVKASGGTISGLTNKSGHYRPTSAEMVQVFDELKSRGVSLSSVRYQHFTGTATNWVAGGAKGAYDSFKRDPNAVPPIEGAAPAAAAPAAAAPAAAATAG
jgi:hypothetical protein